MARAGKAKPLVKKVSSAVRVSALIELMRVRNCLMAAIAVAIGFFLVGGLDPLFLAAVMFSAFLICAGGQVINDVFDFEIDAKLSKTKPIPSKRTTRKDATIFSAGLFIIGVLLASFVSDFTFLIALIFTALLVIYSALLYKTKYLGNVVVAAGTATTFAFGAAAGGEISLLVLTLCVSAFFANMSREITKDIEDEKKDKGFKRTLPMVLPRLAKHFVAVYYLLAIAFALVAYQAFELGVGYLSITVVSCAVFVVALDQLYKGKAKSSQSASKKGMLISLFAYLAAALRV